MRLMLMTRFTLRTCTQINHKNLHIYIYTHDPTGPFLCSGLWHGNVSARALRGHAGSKGLPKSLSREPRAFRGILVRGGHFDPGCTCDLDGEVRPVGLMTCLGCPPGCAL